MVPRGAYQGVVRAAGVCSSRRVQQGALKIICFLLAWCWPADMLADKLE